MAKLNDTQLILLSTAARSDRRNLYPLPIAMADGAERAVKAMTALIKRGLVEECETNDQKQVHRSDGDIRYGLYATDTGIAALDLEEASSPACADTAAPAAARLTKSSLIPDLLRRENGAILADLIEATGWLPHTTRAALTGLRKKGHSIERTKRDGQTCYRIANAA